MSSWRSGQSIVWQGAILIFVPFLWGLLTLSTLTFLLYQAELETKRDAQERMISSFTGTLSSSLLDGFSSLSCYLYFKDGSFLRRYDDIIDQARQARTKLSEMVSDQPEQVEALNHLQDLQERAFKTGQVVCALVQRGATPESFLEQGSMMRQLQSTISEHQASINRFREKESQYVQSHSANSIEWRKRVESLIVFACAANVVLAIVLAAFYSLNIRRRLSLLKENADRLTKNRELMPPLSGGDEIARLDSAFRIMAQTLQGMALKEAALVNNARDVICSVSGARQFTMVSAGAKKLWGYSPDELVGRSIDTIVQDEGTDVALSTRFAAPATASATASAAADLSLSFENKIKHKSGTIANMLWSARWSAPEQSYFCVVHDITDRKIAEDLLRESESRLRTIMESMPVALVIASAEDGRINAANQTTLSLLEYPAMEQVVGCSLSKLIPAYEADSEDPLKMLEIISLFPVGRLTALKGTGAEVPVQISLKHFFYQGAAYILVTMLDMTERSKAEILKQEFVSMIRNDLKEPLLYLQKVLSTFANADQKRFSSRGVELVKQSELEAQRLLSLVTELLNAERPQSSLSNLDAKMNSVALIVSRSIESVRLLAEKCKVSIDNRVADQTVFCDHSRLIQVLVNLLSNAIKFSPPDSTISVTSAVSEGWIELRVIDQGKGIPESHRQTIFDRFVQVPGGTDIAPASPFDAKTRRGTGLGLSICRSIIEAHNGTIGVDSEEGKGSSFWLRLPINGEGG